MTDNDPPLEFRETVTYVIRDVLVAAIAGGTLVTIGLLFYWQAMAEEKNVQLCLEQAGKESYGECRFR